MKLAIKTIFGAPVWEIESGHPDGYDRWVPIPQVGHEIVDDRGAHYVVQAVRHTPHEYLIEVFVLETKAAK